MKGRTVGKHSGIEALEQAADQGQHALRIEAGRLLAARSKDVVVREVALLACDLHPCVR